MDFSLAEERRLLQESLTRFLAKEYSFEKRWSYMKAPEGYSPAMWAQFAELGILGLAIPEDDGGLGGDPFDTMIVMEAFGRSLVIEPYLATVVLGGGTLATSGSNAQKAEWLPGIVAGEKLMAFAHGEAAARYDTRHVTTRAKKAGSGWVLDGTKAVVLNADAAHGLLVSARTAGGDRDAKGISLFLVDPKARGVSVRGYATQDGRRAGEVKLEGVSVDAAALIGNADEGLAIAEAALRRGQAALCAEALGVMEALNAATLDYLKTRQQFGVPIGKFQALQHRMADMTVKAVESRSMAIVAASGARKTDAREAERLVSAAKASIGQAQRFVGQQAVQLHGGIGVTDELIVSHYFKRLAMINATFGDADHHLGRFSDLLLEEA